jgi:hypothetical protein
LHPARLGQTFHGDYVPQDAVHVALTELLFRAIIYLKEHDGIQFWGLRGNLDQKHSLETQEAGPDPKMVENHE